MSELNLVEGDAWYPVAGITNIAQTFQPIENFLLHYVDVHIKSLDPKYPPHLLVYKHNTGAFPPGDKIAGNQYPLLYSGNPNTGCRVRFPFEGVNLLTTKTYCFIIDPFNTYGLAGFYLRFQDGTGTYPRGTMWKFTGSPPSWTELPTSDVIFGAWGDPIATKTPPKPPVKEPPKPPSAPPLPWAPLDIEYYVTATGVREVVYTNSPCHLWMRWTNLQPNPHIILGWDRGTLTDKQKRLATCFWTNKEQQEAGDTLVHTFIDEPWPVCETRWFFFFGYVGGVQSPSTSALFHYHRAKPPPVEELISHYEGTDFRFVYVGDNHYAAECFIPTKNYLMSRAVLNLTRGDDFPATVVAALHETSGGVPTGAALTTCSIDKLSIPLWPLTGWMNFVWPSQIPIEKDTMYAVVCSCPVFYYVLGVIWGRDYLPTGPAGYRCYSLDYGSSWSIWPDWHRHRFYGFPEDP